MAGAMAAISTVNAANGRGGFGVIDVDAWLEEYREK